MAEQITIERLQPCLLDRLTDDAPDVKKVESGTQHFLSESRYKQGVKRDLEWLFTSQAYFQTLEKPKTYVKDGKIRIVTRMPYPNFDLEDYPQARRSVINFGIKQVFGLTSPDLLDWTEKIKEALEVFEPRIGLNYNNADVPPIDPEINGNMATVKLNVDLWVNARRENLHVKTTVDVETGLCLLGDAPHGPAAP